jgi:hypothetical protein
MVRLATEEDAAEVARLMIGFRDWWHRSEPDDAAFEAGVTRVLTDPNAEFLLAGDPPVGVCQLRYRYAIWTESQDCWLEDIYVEEHARGAGPSAVTIFIDDLDARVAAMAARGIEPDERLTYSNGVRKALYRDPDGNELGFGGPPLDTSS